MYPIYGYRDRKPETFARLASFHLEFTRDLDNFAGVNTLNVLFTIFGFFRAFYSVNSLSYLITDMWEDLSGLKVKVNKMKSGDLGLILFVLIGHLTGGHFLASIDHRSSKSGLYMMYFIQGTCIQSKLTITFDTKRLSFKQLFSVSNQKHATFAIRLAKTTVVLYKKPAENYRVLLIFTWITVKKSIRSSKL